MLTHLYMLPGYENTRSNDLLVRDHWGIGGVLFFASPSAMEVIPPDHRPPANIRAVHRYGLAVTQVRDHRHGPWRAWTHNRRLLASTFRFHLAKCLCRSDS